MGVARDYQIGIDIDPAGRSGHMCCQCGGRRRRPRSEPELAGGGEDGSPDEAGIAAPLEELGAGGLEFARGAVPEGAAEAHRPAGGIRRARQLLIRDRAVERDLGIVGGGIVVGNRDPADGDAVGLRVGRADEDLEGLANAAVLVGRFAGDEAAGRRAQGLLVIGDPDRVALGIGEDLEGRGVEQRRLQHDDLAPETVHSLTGHDVDIDEAGIRLPRLLHQLEPGDDPPAMGPEIVPAPHVAAIGLLILEIGGPQILLGIVVVALDVADGHFLVPPDGRAALSIATSSRTALS